MEQLFEEGRTFLQHRTDFKRMKNPSPGSEVFLISLKWITCYKLYLQYERIKKGLLPKECPQKPMGPIENACFLNTDAQKFLCGSGTTYSDKGQESECIDRYIKSEAVEHRHFELCSPYLWKFLADKYGFDFEVRRYYERSQRN